jgi:hypothetical protein
MPTAGITFSGRFFSAANHICIATVPAAHRLRLAHFPTDGGRGRLSEAHQEGSPPPDLRCFKLNQK